MRQNLTGVPTKNEAYDALCAAFEFTPQTEKIPVTECLGRVTSEDIVSINTIPVCRASAMDGYGVKSAAFANGMPDVSKWVKGEDYCNADTGDDFPDEFDTVIPVEIMQVSEDGTVTLPDDYEFRPGSGVRAMGSSMSAGDLIVNAHTKVTPELQVSLAMAGINGVPVVKKPVVAFVPTGNELIPVGTKPDRGQNLETNSLLVKALLERAGAEVINFPIVPDVPERLEAALDEALSKADIVLINGGSSKGSEDYNTKMLERRGTHFNHLVRCVPGKPVGLSVIDGKPVANIPGPPLACWVVCDWLVIPLIAKYLGVPTPERQKVTATLTTDVKNSNQIELFSRVSLKREGDKFFASPIPRGEHQNVMFRDGVGLLISPVGEVGFDAGSEVTVELLNSEAGGLVQPQ